MFNLWSSEDECLLNVEAFLSGMCVWGEEIYINIHNQTWSALMKAFSGCQGNPEAQQIHSFWKWNALERLPGKDSLCEWGRGGTSIAWTGHVRNWHINERAQCREWWVAWVVKCQVMRLQVIGMRLKRRLGPDDERPHMVRTWFDNQWELLSIWKWGVTWLDLYL